MSELTPEEQVEKSAEEVRQSYKELIRYRAGENFIGILEESQKKAEEMLLVIKEEIENREDNKLVNSELDNLLEYIHFVEELITKIDDSEGGKKIKDNLQEQVDRGYTHAYNKVEIGFDAATFTTLDILKNKRNMYMTVDKRIDEVINFYAPKEEDKSILHPYEE